MATNEDFDYQQRLQGWHSFGRLMRWVVGTVIVILVGMAYFLL